MNYLKNPVGCDTRHHNNKNNPKDNRMSLMQICFRMSLLKMLLLKKRILLLLQQ